MTTLPDFSDPCLPLPARSDDAPWASHAWVLAPLVRAGQTFTDLKGSRWVGQRLLHLPLRPPSITGANAGPAARLLFACLAVLLVALVAAIPGVRPRLDPTAPQAAVTESVSSRAPLTDPADPTSPSSVAPSTSPPAAPSVSPTSPISPRLAAPPVLSPAPSTSLPLGLVAPAASPRLPRLHARAPLPAPLPSKPWPRVRVLALDPPAAHEDELGLLPIPMPSSDVEAQG